MDTGRGRRREPRFGPADTRLTGLERPGGWGGVQCNNNNCIFVSRKCIADIIFYNKGACTDDVNQEGGRGGGQRKLTSVTLKREKQAICPEKVDKGGGVKKWPKKRWRHLWTLPNLKNTFFHDQNQITSMLLIYFIPRTVTSIHAFDNYIRVGRQAYSSFFFLFTGFVCI